MKAVDTTQKLDATTKFQHPKLMSKPPAVKKGWRLTTSPQEERAGMNDHRRVARRG